MLIILVLIYLWAGFTTAISIYNSSEFFEANRESTSVFRDNLFPLSFIFIAWPLVGICELYLVLKGIR